MTTLSIITKDKVSVSAKGVDCYLRKTIVDTKEKGEITEFKVYTENCIYEDILDEEGELTGNKKFVTLGQKDKGFSLTQLNFDELSAMYNAWETQYTGPNSYRERRSSMKQYGLLLHTFSNLPYKTTAEDWVPFNLQPWEIEQLEEE